jgi:F-type H+-transporting ATPase subunit gamma
MPVVKNKWNAAVKVGIICESMKNIAAGAMPHAERHLAHARPFGSVSSGFFELDPKDGDASIEPHIKKVLHIAIGTERGMCGSSSSNTVKAIREWIRASDPKGKKEHKVVTYGKRSAAVANTMYGKDLLFSAVEVKTKVPNWEFCCQLAEKLLYEVDYEWDMIRIHFNEYENAIRYWLKTSTVFRKDLAHSIAELQFGHYEVEGEETTIVDSMVEFKLASALYQTLAENFASEQAARLKSMDGATKNCEEMVSDYEKIFQGLRKSKITNELIVLAAAAKMAKGDK